MRCQIDEVLHGGGRCGGVTVGQMTLRGWKAEEVHDLYHCNHQMSITVGQVVEMLDCASGVMDLISDDKSVYLSLTMNPLDNFLCVSTVVNVVR